MAGKIDGENYGQYIAGVLDVTESQHEHPSTIIRSSKFEGAGELWNQFYKVIFPVDRDVKFIGGRGQGSKKFTEDATNKKYEDEILDHALELLTTISAEHNFDPNFGSRNETKSSLHKDSSEDDNDIVTVISYDTLKRSEVLMKRMPREYKSYESYLPKMLEKANDIGYISLLKVITNSGGKKKYSPCPIRDLQSVESQVINDSEDILIELRREYVSGGGSHFLASSDLTTALTKSGFSATTADLLLDMFRHFFPYVRGQDLQKDFHQGLKQYFKSDKLSIINGLVDAVIKQQEQEGSAA